MSQKFKLVLYGIAIGAIALHVVYMIMVLWVTPDVSIFLYIGDLLLDGARPYIDYVEINPPLINYLHVIPVALSRFTGLHIATAFILCVSLLTLLSATLTHYLLKKSIGEQHPILTLTIPIYILLHPFLRITSIDDFGQREFLFIMAYFPFFVLRWLRWRGYTFDRKLSFFIGFIGAVGICIKPHFLLIGFMPELYFLLTHRDLKKIWVPESFGFLLFGLLYALSFLLMPDSTRVLITEILPALLSGYRSSDSPFTPLDYIIYNWFDLGLVFAVTLIGWRLWQLEHRTISHFIFACAVASLMCLIVVIMQGKGYPYHYNHFFFISHMLIIMSISLIPEYIVWGDYPPKIQRVVFAGVFGANFLVAIGLIIFMSVLSQTALRESVLTQVTNKGDYVLVIGGRVGTGYPEVLLTERRYANSSIGAIPIVLELAQFETRQDAYVDDTPYTSPAIEAYLARLVDDINSKQPALIIIDDECFCPKGFSLHEYLERVGFIGEYVLPDYQRLEGTTMNFGYLRINN